MPRELREPVRRILAVRMDNLGDIVMLTPALRALRKQYPLASITLLASPAGSQMAELLPWIDDVLVWRATWQDASGRMPQDPAREASLIQTLRERHFDAALIFTSFTQSPYPPAYAAYLAGIPLRVGLSKEFGGSLITHWEKPPSDAGHQVDRNLDLLRLLNIPADGLRMELRVPPAVESAVDALLERSGVTPGAAPIVLSPGASCSARRYPVDRFARVIQRLAEQTPFPILILGSEKEQESLHPLESTTIPNRIVYLVGQTSVPEMVEIIRRSKLVIANNSAAMHIADAFQIPQVILYSGTEYRSQWQPRYSPAVLLGRPTICSPCYRFECPFDLECLAVHPEEVIGTVLDLLRNPTLVVQTASLSVENTIQLSVEQNGSKDQPTQSTSKQYP
jgi:ADP-heptose:LPS heptosyltransferase